MWLKIAKIDLAGRTKKSIGGADSHYIYDIDRDGKRKGF